MDMSKVPRMSPDDVARAALTGLRLGEVVCAPGLEETEALQRLEEAQRATLSVSRAPALAARYR